MKIQLEFPKYLNRYIIIQKEINQDKDKRDTIIRIIKERLDKDKDLKEKLYQGSEEV